MTTAHFDLDMHDQKANSVIQPPFNPYSKSDGLTKDDDMREKSHFERHDQKFEQISSNSQTTKAS